jgi:hypothetical protein
MVRWIRAILGGDSETTIACKLYEFRSSSSEIFLSTCLNFSSIAGLPTIAGTIFLAPSHGRSGRTARRMIEKFERVSSLPQATSLPNFVSVSRQLSEREPMEVKSRSNIRASGSVFSDAKLRRLGRFASNLVSQLINSSRKTTVESTLTLTLALINPNPNLTVNLTNPNPNLAVTLTNPNPNLAVTLTNPNPTLAVTLTNPNPNPNPTLAVTLTLTRNPN